MSGPSASGRRRRTPLEVGVLGVTLLLFTLFLLTLIPRAPRDTPTNYCPQVPRIVPTGFENSTFFFEGSYPKRSEQLLTGAVKIPTVSYDNMKEDPLADPRFDVFYTFQDFLIENFPLAAALGELEFINTFGLLYTFKGTSPPKTLRPVLLIAHQDVVPVDNKTTDQWDHPPFSGAFDGSFIYGRGTVDTKNTLVGILEAVEALLRQGWQPNRTLLVSFGFDEEIGGTRGAAHIVETLRERYGPDSLEVIVDEGLEGITPRYGSLVAAPAVAEKGFIDVAVELNVPGGHSSIPPDHTAIGIMAMLVNQLEASPFEPSLTDDSPMIDFYQCLAEHTPRMSKELRRTVLNIDYGTHRSDLVSLIESNAALRYTIRTSQALDIFDAGTKINALPDAAVLVGNYRVALDSSTFTVVERVERLALALARQFDLSILSEGETLRLGRHGELTITSLNVLKPSPISPYSGEIWDVIAGTTRHVFENVIPHAGTRNPGVVVAPRIMVGNTDSRHYWDLTRAIYRFSPILSRDMANYHTVNERIHIDGHLSTVAWYYEYIINTTVE